MSHKHFLYFFHVEFRYKDEENANHCFDIGYFSSKQKAMDALERVKDKPGFCDSGGNFTISKCRVYFSQKNVQKENCTIFELYHEFLDDEGFDNYTYWGPFATRAEAEEAYDANKAQYPFSLYPDNFEICDIKVDLYGWREGFTSY